MLVLILGCRDAVNYVKPKKKVRKGKLVTKHKYYKNNKSLSMLKRFTGKKSECLTTGFVISAKHLKKYSIKEIDLMKSNLFPQNQKKTSDKEEFFLIIYSISPGLLKITAKELKTKFIEKFTLETTASNESQLLPISKLLNEFSVVHSTGFCQISNKVLYEVYCEADKDRTEVKKQIEKYLNDYTETEYSWDKVPIKKV